MLGNKGQNSTEITRPKSHSSLLLDKFCYVTNSRSRKTIPREKVREESEKFYHSTGNCFKLNSIKILG